MFWLIASWITVTSFWQVLSVKSYAECLSLLKQVARIQNKMDCIQTTLDPICLNACNPCTDCPSSLGLTLYAKYLHAYVSGAYMLPMSTLIAAVQIKDVKNH